MELITWTEIGIFWTSIVLALITVTATVINYFFFRTQIDPDVIVYVTPDVNRPSVILLVIENIGKGIAFDVSFSSNKSIPERAYGFKDAKVPQPMSSGPFVTGIPALGPGAKRIIIWGQYGGLEKGLGDGGAVNVFIRFKRKNTILPGYKWHDNMCPIDIKSFEGTDASDSNWERKSSEALQSAAKSLKNLSDNF